MSYEEEQDPHQPDGKALILVIQADGKRAMITGDLNQIRLWGSVGTRGTNRFASVHLRNAVSTIMQDNLNLTEMMKEIDRGP